MPISVSAIIEYDGRVSLREAWGAFSAVYVIASPEAQDTPSYRLNPALERAAMSALGHKRTFAVQNVMSALPPCVDGSELARTFFTFAALVGAPMCSAFVCGTRGRWP